MSDRLLRGVLSFIGEHISSNLQMANSRYYGAAINKVKELITADAVGQGDAHLPSWQRDFYEQCAIVKDAVSLSWKKRTTRKRSDSRIWVHPRKDQGRCWSNPLLLTVSPR
jgi:hypothetical protein